MASLWPANAIAQVALDWKRQRRGDTYRRGLLDSAPVDVLLELCL